jgi:hypothetical protein
MVEYLKMFGLMAGALLIVVGALKGIFSYKPRNVCEKRFCGIEEEIDILKKHSGKFDTLMAVTAEKMDNLGNAVASMSKSLEKMETKMEKNNDFINNKIDEALRHVEKRK